MESTVKMVPQEQIQDFKAQNLFIPRILKEKPPRPITMSKTGPCPPKDPYF